MAGLSAAYDAYRASYGGKEAPSENGLTGDQRFFVAFGQSWRGKMRPETLRVIVMTDGHSPDEYPSRYRPQYRRLVHGIQRSAGREAVSCSGRCVKVAGSVERQL